MNIKQAPAFPRVGGLGPASPFLVMSGDILKSFLSLQDSSGLFILGLQESC